MATWLARCARTMEKCRIIFCADIAFIFYYVVLTKSGTLPGRMIQISKSRGCQLPAAVARRCEWIPQYISAPVTARGYQTRTRRRVNTAMITLVETAERYVKSATRERTRAQTKETR